MHERFLSLSAVSVPHSPASTSKQICSDSGGIIPRLCLRITFPGLTPSRCGRVQHLRSAPDILQKKKSPERTRQRSVGFSHQVNHKLKTTPFPFSSAKLEYSRKAKKNGLEGKGQLLSEAHGDIRTAATSDKYHFTSFVKQSLTDSAIIEPPTEEQ